MNKEEIKKILDYLEKHGFVYYGFDKLNYCDLFINQEDWKIERVEIMPCGISFQAYRLDNNQFRYESTPLMLYSNDIEYFKKLYDTNKPILVNPSINWLKSGIDHSYSLTQDDANSISLGMFNSGDFDNSGVSAHEAAHF